MFPSAPLRVLAVEDDPDYAEYLRRLLDADLRVPYHLQVASTLAAGLDLLATDPFDALLLDLGLPDSHGLRTVRQVVEASGGAALIVLTGVDDHDLAGRALSLGAQEYLVKDEATASVLSRAVRYGVDRQRLIDQLEEARRAEAHERELRKVERLAGEPPLRATASLYGGRSFAEREPRRAEAMAGEYARLLDVAVEARTHRVVRENEDLRTLAQGLGFHGATPRDVVQLHTRALRSRLPGSEGVRGQAYVEEGRVLVLELMGHLASWYRLGGVPREQPPSRAVRGGRAS